MKTQRPWRDVPDLVFSLTAQTLDDSLSPRTEEAGYKGRDEPETRCFIHFSFFVFKVSLLTCLIVLAVGKTEGSI